MTRSGEVERIRQPDIAGDRHLLGPRGLGDAGLGEEGAWHPASAIFRLWRSILRRCPKAARVTASSALTRQGRGRGRGVRWTTLEVTFGGGTKAEGGTSKRMRASVRQPQSTPRRP